MHRKSLVLWYYLLVLFGCQVIIFMAAFLADSLYQYLVKERFVKNVVCRQEVALDVEFAHSINYWAEREGVSACLVAAVIQTESSFRTNAISPAGAMGLMQIIPSTWREVNREIKACDGRHGGECTRDCYFNPELNIRIGTAYLSRLAKRYSGDMALAVAAYNAGPGAVDRCGGIPGNGETGEYVKSVIAAWYSYSKVSVPFADGTAAFLSTVKKWAWRGLFGTGLSLIILMLHLNRRYRSWRWR